MRSSSRSILGWGSLLLLLSFTLNNPLDRWSAGWRARLIPGGDWQETAAGSWQAVGPEGETWRWMVRTVQTCSFGGCVQGKGAAHTTPVPSADYFTYGVCLAGKENRVVALRMYEYAGTYGFQMTARWWLQQFLGSKRGADFSTYDGISGATVSTQAFVADLDGLLSVDLGQER